VQAKLRALYQYRYFVFASIKNEFKAKFSRSKFGALWMIINPMVQSIVYALVLSSIISAKLPGADNKYAYPLYLLSGMLAWTLFNEVLLGCVNIFVDRAEVIKKVAFPRACLPIIAAGVALVNNAFLFLAVLVVFVFMGYSFGATILLLPVLVALNFLLAISVGTLFGIFNVFVRDVSQVVLVVLQALFWLTPVVYTENILPASVKNVLAASPIYQVVEAYHAVMVYGRLPDVRAIAWTTLFSCFVATLAMVVYKRAAPDMADVL